MKYVIGNNKSDTQNFGVYARMAKYNELELGDIVKVYPNPVKDVLNINVGSHQIKNVNIYDVNGRLILENNINHHSSNVQLKIPQIKSGIYLLSIETNNGILFKRLIKQ